MVAVVEDHTRVGGLAALLASAGVPVHAHFGWPPDWGGQSGDDEELRRRRGFSAEEIAYSLASRVGGAGLPRHHRHISPHA